MQKHGRKTIAFIIAAMLCFSLAACGEEKAESSADSVQSSVSESTVFVSSESFYESSEESFESSAAAEIFGIAIKDYPNKMKYTVGEEPDFTGMSINIYYSDETIETITDGFECDWHPFGKEGKYMIAVKYKEFKTDLIVDVYEDIEKAETATSISIASLPNKLEYAVGDKPDYTGLKVQAHYPDGTTKIVSGVSCYVHPLNQVGEYVVTVEYESLECTFNIHVH